METLSWESRNREKYLEIKRDEYARNREYYVQKSRLWRQNRERYNLSQREAYRRRKLREMASPRDMEYIVEYPTCSCGRKYLRKLGCLWCTKYDKTI